MEFLALEVHYDILNNTIIDLYNIYCGFNNCSGFQSGGRHYTQR